MNRTLLKIIRFSIYTIELILLYIFQNIPIFKLSFFGSTPLLLIPAFVTICVFERELAAMSFGILTGFLLDLGIGNVLGPQMLAFCLIGYIIGITTTYFFHSGISTAISVSILVTPITVIFNFFLKSCFQSFEFNTYGFYKYILPNIFCTFIFTFFIFLINRVICYYFNVARFKLKQ